MMPSKNYATNDQTMDGISNHMLLDLSKVFHQGVTVASLQYQLPCCPRSFSRFERCACPIKVGNDDLGKETFYFVYVALKGDWPYIRKALNLNTGFTSTRICHHCSTLDP